MSKGPYKAEQRDGADAVVYLPDDTYWYVEHNAEVWADRLNEVVARERRDAELVDRGRVAQLKAERQGRKLKVKRG